MKTKIFAIITALLVCAALLPLSGLAAGAAIDTTRNCSITVGLTYNTAPIGNVRVTIYQVALIGYPDGVNMAFVPTADFAGAAADISRIDDAAQNKAAASALVSYVNAHASAIQGTTQTTNSGGSAVFTQLAGGGSLKPGVYLIVPGYAVGYEAIDPFLASVPTADALGGAYNYNLTAAPKTGLAPVPTNPTAPPAYPPYNPTVTTAPATPTATAPAQTTTPVSGTTQPPSQTTATQPSTGGNQPSTGGDQPSTGGGQPSTGGDQPSTGGNRPSTGGGQLSTGGGNQPRLPQTGALNWPIPVLIVAGVSLLTTGWFVMRKGKGDGE